MIEFGKTLREAREAKGLSIAQLAEMTRMTSSRIEELEKEDFSHIPAAIYGRGFVRLYCEAVGLDPKPLSAEFTEIFNGNRDLEIKERAPAAEPVLPAGAPSPAPTADFHLESREIRPAQPEPIPERPLSRYAAPLDEQPHSRAPFVLPKISIPPAVWRLGLLAIVAIALVWLLCLGIGALYRTVTGGNNADNAALVEERRIETSAHPKSSDKSAPRTPQKVPALYID